MAAPHPAGTNRRPRLGGGVRRGRDAGPEEHRRPGHPHQPSRLTDDIVSELLTEFIAQLARIDIERPHIAARLMLWARKGALRARGRETRDVPCDPSQLPDQASYSDVDPIELLLDAARQEIITPSAAEAIIATRLDGQSVRGLAESRGMPASRLYKQRQTAELRLVAAIREGRISAMSVAPPSSS